MSLPNFSELYRSSRFGNADTIAVHVALRTEVAAPEILERLARLGLNVQTVVANKLTGTLPAARLSDLKDDPDVAAVEPSVTLRPLWP